MTRWCASNAFRSRIWFGACLSLLLYGAQALYGSAAAAEAGEDKIAVLQGLDKITARISTVEAPIDSTVQFGTLKITVRSCRKRPPEETPEVTAFLEITEQMPGETPAMLFTGWMFASSPALNSLEHPVYDIWVIDCITSAPDSPSGSR